MIFAKRLGLKNKKRNQRRINNGLLYFIGYSEFSALHAIEDCENARKLILGRYWKPDKKESDSNKDK